jgi:hypothetical protein
MAISSFLNPIDEDPEETTIQATPDDLLQEVIDGHIGAQGAVDEEEEELEQERPQYTTKDALEAIYILMECTETTEDITPQYIRSLESLETLFKKLQLKAKEQQTLDNWII